MTPAQAPPSRVALHVVLTIGGALAVAAGEVVGNLLFRGNTFLWTELSDELLIGAILGNVVAVWIWWKRKSVR